MKFVSFLTCAPGNPSDMAYCLQFVHVDAGAGAKKHFVLLPCADWFIAKTAKTCVDHAATTAAGGKVPAFFL